MNNITQYIIDNPFAVQIIRGPLAGVVGQVVSIVSKDATDFWVIATAGGKTCQHKADCVRLKKVK